MPLTNLALAHCIKHAYSPTVKDVFFIATSLKKIKFYQVKEEKTSRPNIQNGKNITQKKILDIIIYMVMACKCPAHFRCHNKNKGTTTEILDLQSAHIILSINGIRNGM